MAHDKGGFARSDGWRAADFPQKIHAETKMLIGRHANGFKDLATCPAEPQGSPPRRLQRTRDAIVRTFQRVRDWVVGSRSTPRQADRLPTPAVAGLPSDDETREKLASRGGLSGLALSGGGIRSATLSLGVLQAIAMQPRPGGDAAAAPAYPLSARPPVKFSKSLLAEFDYLSTVSGGGYVGAFLCSLFIPDRVRERTEETDQAKAAEDAADLALEVLCDEPPGRVRAVHRADDQAAGPPASLAWLRDNGRYLTPTGHGDAFYAGSLALRNLVSTHYVIGTAMVFMFAVFTLLEASIQRWRPESPLRDFAIGCLVQGWWISPAFLLCGLVFLALSVPAGAAAWLPHPGGYAGRSSGFNTACGGFLFAGLLFAFVGCCMRPQFWNGYPWLYGAYAAASALVMYWVVWWALWVEVQRQAGFGPDVAILRARLTRFLSFTLQIVCVLAAFGIVDSVSHTIYASITTATDDTTVKAAALATPAGAAGAMVWLVRKLVLSASGKEPPAWLKKLPWQWLAGVVGLTVLALMAVFWALLAIVLVWQGDPLVAVDAGSSAAHASAAMVGGMPASVSAAGEASIHPAADIAVNVSVTIAKASAASSPVLLAPVGAMPWLAAAVVAFVALAVSLAIGRFPSFINISSLLPFYSARLTRAYLGASNKERLKSMASGDPEDRKRASAAEPLESDQVWLHQFVQQDRLSTHAPVHLINITMNNTDAPGEQLVQRDRKGQPVVVSASGFAIDGERQPSSSDAQPSGFELDRTLNLGQWTGISGAALGTGLGRQNSLGLSLLLGAANIRLGAWWRSGRDVKAPDWGSRMAHRLFRTQAYLFGEFTSKFHGLARPYQYLSDGGHFENTGVYELLRPERCTRFIVACDHGADRGYGFDDLANLIRLVRIDMKIELEVDEGAATDPVLRNLFGVPADFRKTARVCPEESCTRSVVERAPRHEPIAILLHASRGCPASTHAWVVLLKPRVRSDSATDVVQYALTHPEFPQETTLDQFFDEAQWESYRKLAFDNATKILAEPVWRALRDYIAKNTRYPAS
jgi:hypothetical protein